jgi:hypothetical protein
VSMPALAVDGPASRFVSVLILLRGHDLVCDVVSIFDAYLFSSDNLAGFQGFFRAKPGLGDVSSLFGG